MGHIGEHVTLDDPAYVHESAWLYGKVYVGPGASIWPNVVTRAETFEISIGARTNIQDFVMIHVGAMTPTIVGEDCSITHHATLHGCTIGDRCLIGINATNHGRRESRGKLHCCRAYNHHRKQGIPPQLSDCRCSR